MSQKRAPGVKAFGTNDIGVNCNFYGDDPGHLGLGVAGQESVFGQAEGAFGCKRRADHMAKHRLSFSAIERCAQKHRSIIDSRHCYREKACSFFARSAACANSTAHRSSALRS